jgi:opacity protein-like surface antigen
MKRLAIGESMERITRQGLMALVILLVVVATAWAADTVRIITERADIFAEANASSRVLATVSRGEVLEVLGREGGWIRVATPGTGYAGYVPVLFTEPGLGAGPSVRTAPRPATPAPTPVPAPAAPPRRAAPAPAPPAAQPPQARSAPAPERVAPATTSPQPSGDVPVAELSAGYAYLYDDAFNDSDISGSFGFGWHLSANVSVNKWAGIVGDISGNYRSEGNDVAKLKLNVYNFHGGFRFSARDNAAVTWYVQALAGGTRHGGSVTVVGVSGGESVTDFSIQPGAGLIFKLSDRLGIDVGGDYVRVFGDDGSNEFRAHVGVAFRVGRK